MDCTYLINMNDGRLVFRNSESDRQVNYKPIPDSVADMIAKGEVTPQDVINAVSMKVKEDGEFDLHKYIEETKKLNVRTSNPQESAQKESLKDRSDEMISAKDVAKTGEKSAKEQKRERIMKVNDALFPTSAV